MSEKEANEVPKESAEAEVPKKKESRWGCPPDSRCAAGFPKIPREDLQQILKGLDNWELTEDGTTIRRAFTAKNWGAAMAFINAVSEVAEAANHHPDFHLTGYRNVAIDLTTHAVGGVTELDLELALKLDQLEVEYSPRWLRERESLQRTHSKSSTGSQNQ
uniref:4a-hydroxytetrahydrobiopterin dehydratase n=1 Tax=Pyramimonas obovata TaxID=1411642 RepID=A0A7S0N2B0_9CHLO|mmetsp:Transcript_17379/g.37814  ORF Transcript_17379/g.37814 Transcript_17379/m.37814 type:complete len:161 (+) Transcript_17379:205-687(+)